MRLAALHKMRVALAAVLILPLAACGGEGAMGSSPKGEAPRQVALFDGEVVVAGPEGYCVDPDSVQRSRGARFALVAGCANLGRTFANDVTPAVVTVSVLPHDGDAEQPSARRLAGPWQASGVLQEIDGDDIALIQLERGGDGLLPGGDPRHWRGAMVINGHMIGLAAYGGAGSAVTGKAGKDVLTKTAKAMRAASLKREVSKD